MQRGGDRQYRPVPWHKLIDGVFIPDGRRGPGAARFGRAHVRRFSARPTATPTAPSGHGRRRSSRTTRAQGPAILDIRHGTRQSSSCRKAAACWRCTPTRASRSTSRPCARSHPGVRPPVSGPSPAWAMPSRMFPPRAPSDGLADVWVFVDGRLKLKRTATPPGRRRGQGGRGAGPRDRFLTLVSTDGGNGMIATGSSSAIRCWK